MIMARFLAGAVLMAMAVCTQAETFPWMNDFYACIVRAPVYTEEPTLLSGTYKVMSDKTEFMPGDMLTFYVDGTRAVRMYRGIFITVLENGKSVGEWMPTNNFMARSCDGQYNSAMTEMSKKVKSLREGLRWRAPACKQDMEYELVATVVRRDNEFETGIRMGLKCMNGMAEPEPGYPEGEPPTPEGEGYDQDNTPTPETYGEYTPKTIPEGENWDGKTYGADKTKPEPEKPVGEKPMGEPTTEPEVYPEKPVGEPEPTAEPETTPEGSYNRWGDGEYVEGKKLKPEPEKPMGEPKTEPEGEPEGNKGYGGDKMKPEPEKPMGEPTTEPEGEPEGNKGYGGEKMKPEPEKPMGEPTTEPEGEPESNKGYGGDKMKPEPEKPMGEPKTEPEGEPKTEPEGRKDYGGDKMKPEPEKPMGEPTTEPEGEPEGNKGYGGDKIKPEPEKKPMGEPEPTSEPETTPEGEPETTPEGSYNAWGDDGYVEGKKLKPEPPTKPEGEPPSGGGMPTNNLFAGFPSVPESTPESETDNWEYGEDKKDKAKPEPKPEKPVGETPTSNMPFNNLFMAEPPSEPEGGKDNWDSGTYGDDKKEKTKPEPKPEKPVGETPSSSMPINTLFMAEPPSTPEGENDNWDDGEEYGGAEKDGAKPEPEPKNPVGEPEPGPSDIFPINSLFAGMPEQGSEVGSRKLELPRAQPEEEKEMNWESEGGRERQYPQVDRKAPSAENMAMPINPLFGGMFAEPEPDPEGYKGGKPEPKGKPEGEPKSKPEGEPKPDPEGYPEGKPEGEPKSKPEGEPKSKPEGEPKPDPEGYPEGKPEGEPKSKPEGKPEPDVDGYPEGKPESKPEGEPKTDPEGYPEGKPEGKPEPDPEGYPEGKPEGKPESKPEGKPEPDPEGYPEGKPEPDPEGYPEGKPEGKPEPDPEGYPEGKPESKSEGEPKPDPEGYPEGKPEGKPESKPEGEPKPDQEGYNNGARNPKPLGLDRMKKCTNPKYDVPAGATTSFENYKMGAWINATEAELMWLPGMGKTPSPNTGPSGAYDGQHYIYMESSRPARMGESAILRGPVGLRGCLCVRFMCHMMVDPYTTIDLIVNGETMQSNGFSHIGWQMMYQTVDVPGEIMVKIRATKGSTFRGDVAVDDITVTPGMCVEDMM